MDWSAGAAAFKDDLDGDLIPGLPDHLSIQRILARISWWDFAAALVVNRAWHGAIQDIVKNTSSTSLPLPPPPLHHHCSRRRIGCVHPAPRKRTKRGGGDDHRSFAISVQSPSLPQSWESLPPIPGLSSGAPLSGRCVCIDSKLFVLGGRDPQSWEFLPDVFVLDLAQERQHNRVWERCAPMSTARSAFACVTAAGKIFVAGGQGDELLTLATAEVYDIASNRWESLPDLNVPRTECSGAVVGGRICVVGGYSSVDKSSCLFDDDDDESATTFWVSSADTISIGARSWETVDDFEMPGGVLPGCSWEIQTGILQSVHKSVLGGLVKRCRGARWRTIDGKVVSVGNGGDQGGGLMLLAAATGKDEVYACSCSLTPSGLVKASLCRALTGGETVEWERIECPFELGHYGASCFLVH